jgi:phosphoenolpyruvate synthase/pyruvate phosphate dikinase
MAGKTKEKQLVWFEEAGKDSVAQVGSKNANLGEMIRKLKCFRPVIIRN